MKLIPLLLWFVRNVEPQYQGIAGMLAAFFLILGIFTGVCFSFFVVWFVENAGHVTSADATNMTTALWNVTEPLLVTTLLP